MSLLPLAPGPTAPLGSRVPCPGRDVGVNGKLHAKAVLRAEPADGEVVPANAPGRLAEAAEVEPPQPALYDPTKPTRALLLSGLAPELTVGPSGAWETRAGAGAVLRVLVVLQLLAGPLVVWACLP